MTCASTYYGNIQNMEGTLRVLDIMLIILQVTFLYLVHTMLENLSIRCYNYESELDLLSITIANKCQLHHHKVSNQNKT